MVEPTWLAPFLVALAAGVVSGAVGFGGGIVFALLLASGTSLLDSLASVKLLAAAGDVAAAAGLFRAARMPAEATAARPLLVCAAGAGLTAAAIAGGALPVLAGLGLLALAAGAIVHARRGWPTSGLCFRDASLLTAFGAYLAAWGFGGGSLWTAHRALGGRPIRVTIAEARVLGAAGNAAAAAAYVCVLPVAWAAILPVLAGHLAGAYGAAFWTGIRGAGSRRAGAPPIAAPAASQTQSVPSRCISEQVSHRLPPRPSTCE